ncbi:MAG: CotH kinase family protein [Melioribacteraceae bacterium]|nr:CotH kinase family protein [Melioribacteraceae bacterium]
MKRFLLSLILLIISNNINAQILIKNDDSWKVYDDSEVAVINITIAPEDLAYVYANTSSDLFFPAVVHFKNVQIDEVIDSVGFRLRGNTSRVSAKKSFKLSFDEYIKDQKFYELERLNLNGEHNDPSICRAKFCWELFEKVGMKSSRAAHAAVYINEEFYGVYISVEHIDDEFLDKRFNDDSGNLWKCLNPPTLEFLGESEDAYKRGITYDLKTNEDADDYTELINLIKIVDNVSSDQFPAQFEKKMNLTSVIKYFAMNVLTGSWDDYWFISNNYYLYHEPEIDQFTWIPYDYDNTFGIDWFKTDWATVNPYKFGSTNGSRPLIKQIMNNQQYRNLYTHFLEFYSENVFDLDLWESSIDTIKNRIVPFVAEDNYMKLDYGFWMNDFYWSFTDGDYSNKHVKRGIKSFINARNSSLKNYLNYENADPIIYQANYFPKYLKNGDTLKISASVFSHLEIKEVKVRFTNEDNSVNEFPMEYLPIEGTTLVEENDLWKTSLVIGENGLSGKFKIIAEDNSGNIMEYPRDRYYEVRSSVSKPNGLIINEFLAQNTSFGKDEAGEFDDWLELYNSADSSINLKGYYLTDNPDNLRKWKFPTSDIILDPGFVLIVWCDEDGSQGELHANFKLSAGGEFIALVKNDGATILDSLTFGEQTEDVSMARLPDGSENWIRTKPSPGELNLVISVDEQNNLPEQYSLNVYPNPFNPATTIEYTIPAETDRNLSLQKTTLTVYNLLGQKIETLVNETKPPGKYKVTWNASNLASGVYILNIRVNAFFQSQKMLLQK